MADESESSAVSLEVVESVPSPNEKERPIPPKAPAPDKVAFDAAVEKRENQIELLKKKIASDLQPQIKMKTEVRQQCRAEFQEKLKILKGMREEQKQASKDREVIHAQILHVEQEIDKRGKNLAQMRKNLRHNTTVSIDDEIRHLEEKLAHSSLTLKEEKDTLAVIKQLKSERVELSTYEQHNQKQASTASNDRATVENLKLMRKEKIKQVTILKEKADALNDHITVFRQNEEKANADVTKLIAQKKEANDTISKLLDEQREARKEFRTQERAYNDYTEYQAFLRRQKARAEKEARMESQKAEQEEFEKEQALLDHWAEEKELCSQLLRYVKRFLPSEKAPATHEVTSGSERRRDIEDGDNRETSLFVKNVEDDFLGFGSKKKVKPVSKAPVEPKKKAMIHTPDVFVQFDQLDLTPPMDFSAVEKSIGELEEKMEWLNSSPDKSVKEQLKKDRELRNKKEKPKSTKLVVPVAEVSEGHSKAATEKTMKDVMMQAISA